MYKIKYRDKSEMKDSGIEWLGEIPQKWKVLRNKNIFEYRKKLIIRAMIQQYYH